MSLKDNKVLFMTKEIPDYLHDAVYCGFKDIGCVVEDYPRKGTLHNTYDETQRLSNQLFFSFPEETIEGVPDLLVITPRLRDQSHADLAKELVEKRKPKKIVILDGLDEPDLSYLDSYPKANIVFKRELVNNTSGYSPINFCPIPKKFIWKPFHEREYDVSFIATISSAFRVEVANHIKQKADELGLKAFVHCAPQMLPKEVYTEVLANSKTAVSVRGAGWDCYRYWEIPVSGTVLISEDLPISIIKDYTSEHCFKFSSLGALSGVLRMIKEFPVHSLECMALEGMKHTVLYHRPVNRAAYILNNVRMYS